MTPPDNSLEQLRQLMTQLGDPASKITREDMNQLAYLVPLHRDANPWVGDWLDGHWWRITRHLGVLKQGQQPLF